MPAERHLPGLARFLRAADGSVHRHGHQSARPLVRFDFHREHQRPEATILRATFQGTYRFSDRTNVGATCTLSRLSGNVDGESVTNGPVASSILHLRGKLGERSNLRVGGEPASMDVAATVPPQLRRSVLAAAPPSGRRKDAPDAGGVVVSTRR